MTGASDRELWLAPLRGVTIRAFRTVFADAMRDAGFMGSFAPFIPANAGFRYSRRLFSDILPELQPSGLEIVPQVIGKDPAALREWCRAVKGLGYVRADLNAAGRSTPGRYRTLYRLRFDDCLFWQAAWCPVRAF